jgi:nucleoside-diphosphate-sugar epimerase
MQWYAPEVYGLGSRYLGSLISAIDRLGSVGIPFIGKGDKIAPLIHVKDIARTVYLAGIERYVAGQVFNIPMVSDTAGRIFLMP